MARRWHIPCNILENFDCELQEFYFEVAGKETELNQNNVPLIKRTIEEELRDILNFSKKKGSLDILYNSSVERCAYMLKYAPCITYALTHHFLELISRNISMLLKDKYELNICCLGGGPGTEVVALSKIFSAIDDLNSEEGEEYEPTLKLHVTIVDKNDSWENMVQNIEETLKGTPNFFNCRKLGLELSFVNADLTKSWNVEVQDAVKNADIVSMVYLLSEFPEKVLMKNLEPIQELIKHMKDGALLFYLDSSLLDGKFKSAAESCEGLRHFPKCPGHLNQLYIMSLDSMKKHIELGWNKFNQIICQPHCKYSVSVWIKTNNSTVIRSARSHSLSSKKDIKKEKKVEDFLVQSKLKQKEFDKKTRDEHEKKLQQFHWQCQLLLPKMKSANSNRNAKDQSGMNEYYQGFYYQEEESGIAESFDDLYFQAKPKNKRRFTYS